LTRFRPRPLSLMRTRNGPSHDPRGRDDCLVLVQL
jgi:hypothetical protein